MRTRTLIPAAAAAAVLALPAAAQAHVTVNPGSVPAGSYQVLSVRVPNEDDKAATTKLRLQFPAGFTSVSYEAQAGWKAKVVKRRLARPIQTAYGPVSQEVASITWTGTRRGLGRIAPGQFRDFRISVKVPGKAGDTLTFKALQTYSNGTVVRWIGRPGADNPAPTVTVAAPAGEHAHGSRAGARAAHAGIVRRTPAAGTSVRTVKKVSITFSQRLVTGRLDVLRAGRRVAPASTGPRGATVSASFAKALPRGAYTVRWRAVAADGHVQSGSWAFRVR
jgi:periplasmic copper chaperone A